MNGWNKLAFKNVKHEFAIFPTLVVYSMTDYDKELKNVVILRANSDLTKLSCFHDVG